MGIRCFQLEREFHLRGELPGSLVECFEIQLVCDPKKIKITVVILKTITSSSFTGSYFVILAARIFLFQLLNNEANGLDYNY